MKKWNWMASFLTVFLFVLSLGLSQESKPKWRQEVIKLKYRQALGLKRILDSHLSSLGKIEWSVEYRDILSISDDAETVEKILKIIKELDVKPADLQFTIQLVLASHSGEEPTDAALKDDPIIKELSTLLKFKSFSLLDTSLVRAVDASSSLTGGYSEVTMGERAELRLSLRPTYVKEDKTEIIQVEARLQKMGGIIQAQQETRREWSTLLSSNFSIRSGEKTVVGVSKMDGGDKALILIISGKVI